MAITIDAIDGAAFEMTAKADEMKERRRLAGSTTTITNDNPPTTFHALANLDSSLGGRFATGGDVSGTDEVVRYPRLPSTSPWASDPVGVEPPTNYRIDELEPTGEFHELVAPGPLEATSAPAPTIVGDLSGAGVALQVGSKASPKVDGPSSRDVAASGPGVPFLSSGEVERDIPAFSSGSISREDLADLLGRLVVPAGKDREG
jgi:hypothetical protein